MYLFIISATAIILYLTASVWLGHRFVSPEGVVTGRDRNLLLFSCPALILHAVVLYQQIFTEPGLNMGFYNALSLVSWLVAVLVVLGSLVRPTGNLAMFILPVTALALLLAFLLPSDRIISGTASYGLDAHIVLSISAYSLLTLAALQAVVLAVQERQLRSKHPVRVMRLMPPMQVMEEVLVQLLWLGYFLLSLGLVAGLMFVDDIMAQHLVHKTVLSILAWLIFGLVLFGRWAWGWRGKHLVRWTLGWFLLLMLGYFGSKFVLELVLQRV